MAIPIRTPGEIDAIVRTADVVARAIDAAIDALASGMTTLQLADIARDVLLDAGAETLFDLETNAADERFPHAVSISVNEQAVHGVPSDRVLEPGDLVTVDVGGRLDGWCADLARTTTVGAEPSDCADAARAITQHACEGCFAGVSWGDVVAAARGEAERLGVYLLDGFAGHGIGRALHEPPTPYLGPSERARSVGDGSRRAGSPSHQDKPVGARLHQDKPAGARLHQDKPAGARLYQELILRPGMVITIEPIVCERPVGTVLDADGWTARSRDGSRACYEERMVAITRVGPRMLGLQA